METQNPKPLGRPSYGSIGHLPGSRVGAGDHHINPGQAKICTEKPRDLHDEVFVQEKLDGSNVGVANVGGQIVAIVRAGYLASTSPYEQHHHFADWVRVNEQRFSALLQPGERLCGEWLMQAHGTRYQLEHEPFVAFDLMIDATRLTYDEFHARLTGSFVIPRLLHRGPTALSIESMLTMIEHSGHGALDPVEGAVWRVERKTARKGRVVDFLCKYVRHEKADGQYLPELTGKPPVWNWHPTTK